MPALCLTLGLNTVDPAAYNGWDGLLNACESDARDMSEIAESAGYTTTMLLSRQATSSAVLGYLHEAAAQLQSGDHLLLTYSGHGGQIDDLTSDEADDQLDETWCLHDRMLLDDELFAMWARFRPGVRILMLSDSCHSGSMAKNKLKPAQVPPGHAEFRPKRLRYAQAQGVVEQHKAMYDSLQYVAGPAEKAAIAARVILISGCQDDQESMDGPKNGAFTAALLKVWNKGAFAGSHAQFHQQIADRLQGTQQTPNFFTVGAHIPAFDAARPFTP
jgi:hypothetical protein